LAAVLAAADSEGVGRDAGIVTDARNIMRLDRRPDGYIAAVASPTGGA
jgi:hypothetical protein